MRLGGPVGRVDGKDERTNINTNNRGNSNNADTDSSFSPSKRGILISKHSGASTDDMTIRKDG